MRASPLLFPVIAVVPLVGAAAIRIPDLFGGPLVVLIGGYFLIAAFALLPHRSSVFALGWWLLALVSLVPPMLPSVAVPGVGVFRIPVVSGPWVWWVGAGLSLAWWWVWFRAPVTFAYSSDDPPETEPVEVVEAVPEPRFSGPLRVIPDTVKMLPLGVDRVAPQLTDENADAGIADMLLDVWPKGAAALHLDEVADLLRMSGAESRDVREALTSEGVTVADRVGRRRNGKSISKPGVRLEDVEEASQRDRDPSRAVTTA